MSSIFTFASAVAGLRAGTTDLVNDTYYAHLVTATPLPSVTEVSGLSLVSYPAYLPQELTSKSHTAGVWKFSDITWPIVDGSSNVSTLGFVVCRQAGASPASTDQPIIFSRLRSSAAPISITLSPGERLRALIDQTHGVLKTESKYIFEAGNYSYNGDPFGVFYLLGTRNGRQAFANPRTTGVMNFIAGSSPGQDIVGANLLNPFSSDRLTDRNYNTSGPAIGGWIHTYQLLNGRSLNLAGGTFMAALFTNGTSFPFILYGSKGFPNPNSTTDLQNVGNWTQIAAFTITISNPGMGTYFLTAPIPSTVDDYFPYIGLRLDTGSYYETRDLEFYNVKLASSTADLTNP